MHILSTSTVLLKSSSAPRSKFWASKHERVATLSARSSAVRAWNGRSPGWRIGLGRARGGTPYHFDAKPCAAAISRCERACFAFASVHALQDRVKIARALSLRTSALKRNGFGRVRGAYER